MDFHSLTRKELQTLCKKNKIPANITNVAMADALKALKIPEGIEEFLNPSESVPAQSLIDSPEKSEVTSPCVPRTGGRTTRRKTVKDDDENSQTLTRTRRSTRKFVIGDTDEKPPSRMAKTPAATNSRKAPVASVRRKMDVQLKEVEEDHKIGNKDISETPAVSPGNRRRGLMGENTASRTYGTRRSARLAQKNVESANLENGKLETVKSDLFPEESGENLEILEMNVKEPSDDLGEIVQTTDIDLKEELEEGLGRNNDKEVTSDKKSDCVIENHIQIESKFDKESSESLVVLGSEMKIQDDDGVEGDACNVEYKDAGDSKAEVHSDISEEIDPSTDILDKPLEMNDEVEEKSGDGDLYSNKAKDASENEDKLDTNEEKVSENVAAESVEKRVDHEVQEKSGGVDLNVNKVEDTYENEDKLDAIEEMVFDHVAAETVEKEINAQSDAFSTDNKTVEMSDDLMDLINDGDSESSDNPSVTEEVLENAKMDNDMGFHDGLVDHLETNKYSEDLAASDTDDGGLLTKEDGFYSYLAEESVESLSETEEQGLDLVIALEAIRSDNSHSLEEEYVDNNLMDETTASALNASVDVLSEFQTEEESKSCNVVDSEKSPTKQLGNLDASDGPVSYNVLPATIANDMGEVCVFSLTADPSKILSSSVETELSRSALPTSLTPSKKSTSKTPVRKSASKKTPTTTTIKLSLLFDDKENIDNSGTKLTLAEEKKQTKDFGQSKYVDLSLRKLKKEVKKLEISKNSKKDENSRPVLQAVSENIVD